MALGSKEQVSVAKSLIEDIVENQERTQMYLDSALARREPRLPPKTSESPRSSPDSPRSERISPFPGKKKNNKHFFLIYSYQQKLID